MTKTISHQVTFNAKPAAVYAALMDHAFTGAPAQIEPRAGGPFSVFGGMIQGITVDLKENERIVQAWRAKNWPEGVYSLATFQLAAEGDGTRLSFLQVGVPEDQAEHITKGWEQHYWSKLPAFLSR